MGYANVAVDVPIGPSRSLSYSVPQNLSLVPGNAVLVPVGSRLVCGVVVGLVSEAPNQKLRPILGLMDSKPLLAPYQLQLAEWISTTYSSGLFDAIALMLPPSFRRRLRTVWSLPEASMATNYEDLSDKQRRVISFLRDKGPREHRDIVRSLGPGAWGVLTHLHARGLVKRSWRWDIGGTGHRYEALLKLRVGVIEATTLLQTLVRRAPKQAALLEYLVERGVIPATQARKEFGASAVSGLNERGSVGLEWRQKLRGAWPSGSSVTQGEPLSPSREQAVALEAIYRALDGEVDGPRSFLLHGVTGSGKTEVYLQSIRHCLTRGLRALFLVPEISLTPQFLQRLRERFPGQVGVLHSALSHGESFDTWWRVRRGEFGVVLGPRSALFAPQQDLGLIVMDEEHEWTYKQQEASPRYHARETALRLGELTGATVVFGSATPDVTTYHAAKDGYHKLLRLPNRLDAGRDSEPVTFPMPEVRVVDMREELKAGNRGIFSGQLHDAIEGVIARNEQALLFINRRGSAGFVQCRDCGYVLRCTGCDTPLTYHSIGERLRCHLCGRNYRLKNSCPSCVSTRIRYLGVGTQRVAEEVTRIFGVPTLRWDRDLAYRRGAHQELMERFIRGEAPVLVGTQVVAKGLHLPRVTLVGAVLSDIGLYLPDFRAGERSFQLLCQVAGRAGRGDRRGQVILQTYSPNHYAVIAAAAQDYEAFYCREIAYRREYRHPPYSRMIRLLFTHLNDVRAREEATRLGRRLLLEREAIGLVEVDVIGPAPAYPARIRGRYRWHVILRGPDPMALVERVLPLLGWSVDVDPVALV